MTAKSGYYRSDLRKCLAILALSVTAVAKTCCTSCYNRNNAIGVACKLHTDEPKATWNDVANGLYGAWNRRISIRY